MKVVYFTHSLLSCWNHGNAHFLRGVLRDLIRRGHAVSVLEPEGAWSLENLLADHGEPGLDTFRSAYPELRSERYDGAPDLPRVLDGADVVLVHEWTEPDLVAAIGRGRIAGGRFTLLFHDTHHRAVSDPDAIRAFDLSGYDGVLAFGEALAEVYREWGWGDRVAVWHEAADVALFRPADAPHPHRPALPAEGEDIRTGLCWIGNWGDGERTAELESYLFRPAEALGLPLDIWGVRYPQAALATLVRYGVRYHGWLPNARAPAIFARHLATAHVPRRFYVDALPGIPTIRVFEALACGIPLVSAPWRDTEALFRVGTDFLMARDPADMTRLLASVRDDPDLRASLASHGLQTILARHTCTHRVDELLAHLQRLGRVLETA